MKQKSEWSLLKSQHLTTINSNGTISAVIYPPWIPETTLNKAANGFDSTHSSSISPIAASVSIRRRRKVASCKQAWQHIWLNNFSWIGRKSHFSRFFTFQWKVVRKFVKRWICIEARKHEREFNSVFCFTKSNFKLLSRKLLHVNSNCSSFYRYFLHIVILFHDPEAKYLTSENSSQQSAHDVISQSVVKHAESNYCKSGWIITRWLNAFASFKAIRRW